VAKIVIAVTFMQCMKIYRRI